MPSYHRLGQLPEKRHTTFFRPDGKLYSEQLISSEGFSSDYSLTYHVHRPTLVLEVEIPIDVMPHYTHHEGMISRSFRGYDVPEQDDYLASRQVVLGNDDILISLAAPRQSMQDYFYKNSQAW